MRECDVEQYLVDKVRSMGGRAYKWASPSHRGVPDRLVILPGGRVIAVECKRPGGKVTPLQELELERLLCLGLTATVVDSPESVDRLLDPPTYLYPFPVGD